MTIDQGTKCCDFKGCSKIISSRYRFCFDHKNEKYIETCKHHGETTHTAFKCGKCKAMRRSIYRVHRKDGKYWIYNRLAPKDHKMSSYFKDLIHANRRYASKFISNVTKGPGTYGIFKRDGRSSIDIGKCLYVGQSVDVRWRVGDHIDKVKRASKGENGLPHMYALLAEIGIENIKFVRLMGIPKPLYSTMNKDEALEALSLLEQYGMDSFEPELNVTAARKTVF